MFRLSGVLRQPGPERGEGSQWERRGWGSDLLSVETSGGGRRGSGRGGSGVGPSDCAKGKADRSGDRREVMQPALPKVLRFPLGHPQRSSLTKSAIPVAFIVTGLKLKFRGLFCEFQGCN